MIRKNKIFRHYTGALLIALLFVSFFAQAAHAKNDPCLKNFEQKSHINYESKECPTERPANKKTGDAWDKNFLALCCADHCHFTQIVPRIFSINSLSLLKISNLTYFEALSEENFLYGIFRPPRSSQS